MNCAVQLVKELTDEEIDPQYSGMVFDIIFQNQITNFLLRILVKIDDQSEESEDKIQIVLDLLENMLDIKPLQTADKIVHNDNLIDYILTQIHNLHQNDK